MKIKRKRRNQTFRQTLYALVSIIVAGLCAFSVLPVVAADSDRPQQALVEEARLTLERFLADSEMTWFHDHLQDAKGVLIIPRYFKAALIVGGGGGSGVLLVKNEQTDEWSEPAFYGLGAVGIGLQAGGQSSEIILLVMTNNGLETLYTHTSFKLGLGASIAVGPIGTGIDGAVRADQSALNTDFLSFARAKGVFVGVSLEGATIQASNESNTVYYGKGVRPRDILMTGGFSNPMSAELRAAIANATQKP